jgi:hypothetical protein
LSCIFKTKVFPRKDSQSDRYVPVNYLYWIFPMEVLDVKAVVFILLLFAPLPDCSQNQTAVSYTLHLLSDF